MIEAAAAQVLYVDRKKKGDTQISGPFGASVFSFFLFFSFFFLGHWHSGSLQAVPVLTKGWKKWRLMCTNYLLHVLSAFHLWTLGFRNTCSHFIYSEWTRGFDRNIGKLRKSSLSQEARLAGLLLWFQLIQLFTHTKLTLYIKNHIYFHI